MNYVFILTLVLFVRHNFLLKSLVFFLIFFTFKAISEDISQKIIAFREKLLIVKPVRKFSLQHILSRYPEQLLLPSKLLPQTSSYNIKELQKLYKFYKSDCKGDKTVDPRLLQPLVFTRAMCLNLKLPPSWFSRANYIHPGGGSYAKRYIEKYPKERKKYERFLHIRERSKSGILTELGQLQRMNETAIENLVTGTPMILSGPYLWFKTNQFYSVYPKNTWKKIADELGLSITIRKKNVFCLEKLGNVCVNKVENKDKFTWYLFIILIILNFTIIFAWIVSRWIEHRKILNERMLILQILTHELRTPIASLGMTVEGFRKSFDKLPDSLYDEFRRLCEDSRRLRQLAEASKDYLLANQGQMKVSELESLNSWLSYICESYNVNMHTSKDTKVFLNVYWLGTCIDNLLSNATKYGVAPIELYSNVESGQLVIKIIDQGNLKSSDWNRLKKPFESKSGLGLGLTIVESMIKKMGGTLRLEGPPTTFIMEIPCESNDTVSRR